MKKRNEIEHYNVKPTTSRNSDRQQYPGTLHDSNHDEYGEDYEEIDHTLVENMERETQETLLRTFEFFYEQESEIMISALAESRNFIKHSMIDLVEEQDKMKEELSKVSEGKYEFKRRAG